MNGLPTWLRVWLAGMWWGTLSGVLTALGVIALLGLSSAGNDWLDWSGANDVVLGLIAAVVFGSIYGSVIGFFVGCLTGLVAGPVLEVALWRLAPKAAVPATVAFVLSIQFCIGAALTEDVWWVNLVVPAISLIPMWLVMRRVVRELEDAVPARRRDTLAA